MTRWPPVTAVSNGLTVAPGRISILSESRSDAYESKAAFASSAPRAGPSCFTLGGSGSQTNGVARGGGCDSFRTSKAVPIATLPNASDQSSMRVRSEEHTSELPSLMRISYAVFCLKKKKVHHNK